jgi:hypothetical protein
MRVSQGHGRSLTTETEEREETEKRVWQDLIVGVDSPHDWDAISLSREKEDQQHRRETDCGCHESRVQPQE